MAAVNPAVRSLVRFPLMTVARLREHLATLTDSELEVLVDRLNTSDYGGAGLVMSQTYYARREPNAEPLVLHEFKSEDGLLIDSQGRVVGRD